MHGLLTQCKKSRFISHTSKGEFSVAFLKTNFKNDYMIQGKDEEYAKYADIKKTIIVDFGHGKYVGVIVKE